MPERKARVSTNPIHPKLQESIFEEATEAKRFDRFYDGFHSALSAATYFGFAGIKQEKRGVGMGHPSPIYLTGEDKLAKTMIEALPWKRRREYKTTASKVRQFDPYHMDDGDFYEMLWAKHPDVDREILGGSGGGAGLIWAIQKSSHEMIKNALIKRGATKELFDRNLPSEKRVTPENLAAIKKLMENRKAYDRLFKVGVAEAVRKGMQLRKKYPAVAKLV